MKSLIVFASVLLGCSSLATATEGFTQLFNGRNLDGWKRVNGQGEFRVEDGCIVGFGENVKNNTFLRTEKTYRNFDFRFEMKFDDLSGNSGMMFRGLQGAGEDGRVQGYQCEHDNNKERAWTACLYDEARRGWLSPLKGDTAAEKAATEAGKKIFRWQEWNQIRIVCEDRKIRIWLNGEERVNFTDEDSRFTPEGFFALQVHSGKSCRVRWKNIEVREL